eukprot:985515-Amphidinium_carterae.1
MLSIRGGSRCSVCAHRQSVRAVHMSRSTPAVAKDMSDVPLGVETVNILLVGECGDGKSTLVNALRDPTKSQQALCGKNAEGVTKDIVLYPCRDLSIGKALNILDTPGVGDHH